MSRGGASTAYVISRSVIPFRAGPMHTPACIDPCTSPASRMMEALSNARRWPIEVAVIRRVPRTVCAVLVCEIECVGWILCVEYACGSLLSLLMKTIRCSSNVLMPGTSMWSTGESVGLVLVCGPRRVCSVNMHPDQFNVAPLTLST